MSTDTSGHCFFGDR